MASIPDNRSAGVSSAISISIPGTVGQIRVSIDLGHPYIGDLRVALTSPTGRSSVLHPQLGGPADNLVETYDSLAPGSMLSAMAGQPMMGVWTLDVSDRAAADIGTLRRWSLELRAAPA
jgi:subtilisin-like proprotein convertase family protein